MATYAEILNQALWGLTNATGFPAAVTGLETVANDIGADATIQVDMGKRKVNYLAEIKLTVNEGVVGRMAHQLHRGNEKWILVTRYVPVQLAQKLKQAGIEFIDTAGNIYLDQPPVLIFTTGNRATNPNPRRNERGLFALTTTKILFALLCKEGLENATQREIAEAAKVGLGGVPGALKELTQQGYLLDVGPEKKKLVKKKDLLEKWIAAYIARIPQKTFINNFTATRENFWEDIDLGVLGGLWGGEVAANKLTQYLKPEKVTIYTDRGPEKLVAELKLRRDDNGRVELRNQFWDFDFQPEAKDITPVLLIYADLLATPDPRNLETGKLIYDQYLKRHFE